MADEDGVLRWIDRHLAPVWRSDGAHLYDGMDSQAAFSLPLIHVPFDPDDRSHWVDRGRILDFRAVVGGGRILDIGSGDGWPCLPLAEVVDEVVAVDANATLLAGAKANARRMGIENVSFVGTESATRLPFEDGAFTGVTAASSLEQTEDPQAALAEIHRVLRPEGMLRMYYEALSRYRGAERGLWLMGLEDGTSYLYLSDYEIDAERARHLRLHVDMKASEIRRRMDEQEGRGAGDHLSLELLEDLSPQVRDARGSTLRHPHGVTWLRLLAEAGFREVQATRSGAEAAAAIYDELPSERRPRTCREVDELLRPEVDRAVRTPCGAELDPMITARR